jgi:hypothetical protein
MIILVFFSTTFLSSAGSVFSCHSADKVKALFSYISAWSSAFS